MAFTFDAATGKMTLPRGDTANISVTVTGASSGSSVVFKVMNKATGEWAVIKSASIISGTAEIRIASNDTAQLDTGAAYGWTVGMVTGMDTDAQDNLSADDITDDVVTAFNDLKPFKLLDSGIMGK